MTNSVPVDTASTLQAIPDADRQTFVELIESSCERLRRQIHRMLHQRFPHVCRWEETDDVLQQSLLRLYVSLQKIQPHSVREFYGLAAKQIRWELIDLCRHYFGPQGLGANYESDCGRPLASSSWLSRHEPADDTAGPAALAAWAEFHEQVEKLPDEEREVFDLIWYQQVSQEDAASLLGVSVRTVKRRWQRAKLLLHRRSAGNAPNKPRSRQQENRELSGISVPYWDSLSVSVNSGSPSKLGNCARRGSPTTTKRPTGGLLLSSGA